MLNSGKGRAQHGAPLKNLTHLPPKSPLFSSNPVHLDPFRGTHVGNLHSLDRGYVYEKYESESEAIPPPEPSWLNELLDSPKVSQRRYSHRRSASDTITFIDSPTNVVNIDGIAEEEEFVPPFKDHLTRSTGSLDFDQLDEEQIVKMFSHLKPFENPPANAENLVSQAHQVAVSKPYRPLCISDSRNSPLSFDSLSLASKHHVIRGHGPEVAKNYETFYYDDHVPTSLDNEADKELQHTKRLSNRQSAQRSRVRKLQYIAELERRVNDLQTEVAALSSQVAYLDHQRLLLSSDNKALKQRISTVLNERQFKDAHIEVMKKERQRLRLLLFQQKGQLIPLIREASKPVAGLQQDKEASPVVTDAFVRLVKASSLPANFQGADMAKGWAGRIQASVKNNMSSGCNLSGNTNTLEAATASSDFRVQNS